MLWGHTIAYWYFAASFVTGTAMFAVSQWRMRSQVNRLLPKSERIPSLPPDPESIWELFSGTKKIAYVFTILDEHRKHYPSSSLRTIFGVALLTCLLSGMGMAVTEILRLSL